MFKDIVLVFAVALVLTGALGVAWAVSELSGGAADIPMHWWSAISTVPLFVGLALAAYVWRRRSAK